METATATQLGSKVYRTADANGARYNVEKWITKKDGTQFPVDEPITDFTFAVLAVIRVNGNEARTLFKVQRSGAETEQLSSELFDNVAQFNKWCHARKLQWSGSDQDLKGLFALLASEDVPEIDGIEQVGLHLEPGWPRTGTFILPNGDVIGDSDRYVYAEPVTRPGWHTDLRPSNDWDPEAVKLLAELHRSEIMTPLLGWVAAAPLRALFPDGFPVLGVFGSAGWGKTTLVSTVLDVFGFHTSGSPPSLGGATPHSLKARMAASNGIPVWFDEYRARACKPETMEAFEQAWRKAWDNGVVETGGGAGNWAELVPWPCSCPLLVSGESAVSEVSLLERTIVLNLPPGGRNAAALTELKSMDDELQAPAYSWSGFGRSYLEWLHDRIGELRPPHIADRHEHGLAVVKWGYGLLQEFVGTWGHSAGLDLGVTLPDFDSSWVTDDAADDVNRPGNPGGSFP